jgi:hypothetical protein
MLKIIQCFGTHYSCHLQGEYIMVGRFWQPYTGQAEGGELDFIVLIGDTCSSHIGQQPALPLHQSAQSSFPHACYMSTHLVLYNFIAV